eukprot:2221-Heterococcus_DN1.PRE.1
MQQYSKPIRTFLLLSSRTTSQASAVTADPSMSNSVTGVGSQVDSTSLHTSQHSTTAAAAALLSSAAAAAVVLRSSSWQAAASSTRTLDRAARSHREYSRCTASQLSAGLYMHTVSPSVQTQYHCTDGERQGNRTELVGGVVDYYTELFRSVCCEKHLTSLKSISRLR